jgi:predicted flavoprotein YhiN
MKINQHNIIIIGAGSAGMCFAIRAAERGRNVLVIETRRQQQHGIDEKP